MGQGVESFFTKLDVGYEFLWTGGRAKGGSLFNKENRVIKQNRPSGDNTFGALTYETIQ
jgi:hypothetical protein